MNRNCGICRQNKNESENSCGYLPPEARGKKVYIAPYFQDTKNLRSDVCPVHTYLENIQIYEYINIAKNMSPLELSFVGRSVLETYKTFMSLKQESELKSKTTNNVVNRG